VIKNPFATVPGALENSSYSKVAGEKLVSRRHRAHNSQLLGEMHAAFRALLHDPDFPCVGAKSVINQGTYRFGLYNLMAAEGSTAGLAYDLYEFIRERPRLDGDFSTFIACFVEPKVRRPKEFEMLLWHQLAALNRVDRQFHDWNAEVSADPSDDEFSFSFGEHAFFVVGLAPSSDRWARRFPWPTLVFNDHKQFEKLRVERRFDRLKTVIRERDKALHGTANTMLADYGAHSEARQYAGRRVSENWRCPVTFK
jgi:FPC/CPF motif-containing protein YcgG